MLRRGEDKWSWLAGVLPDLISLKLLESLRTRSLCTGAQWRSKPSPPTLPATELQRRRTLLLWSLLRSPVFDAVLRKPIEGLDRIWRKIPILNCFNLIELALILRPFYFTTSGTWQFSPADIRWLKNLGQYTYSRPAEEPADVAWIWNLPSAFITLIYS